MSRRALLGLSLCLCILVAALPARAEPVEPPPEKGDVDAAGLRPRLQEALRRYKDHDYASAAAEFQALYEQAREPNLLYNAAYSLHWLGRCDEARRLFERYLAEDPKADAATREEVSARLRQCQPARAIVEAPPPPRPPLPPPPPPPRTALWAGIGVSAALAVTAAFTGGFALSSSGELSGSRYVGAAPPQGLTDLQTRTQALALTTDVALGTSAVALGTGLVVYLVQRARHRAAAPALIAAPRTTLARNARE